MRVPGLSQIAVPAGALAGARGAAGAFGWRRALIGLIVLGGSSVLGYQLYQRTLGQETAPVAPVQTVVAARRSLVERVSLPGSVAAARQSKLSFASSGAGVSVSGTVRSISVRTGDAVKQGQELARLDTTSLDLSVQTAQAALTIARSRYATLLAGALPPDVASAEQSVISAQAALNRAQADLDDLRAGGQAADRSTKQQSVLNAQNALTTAQLALDALQSRAAQSTEAGVVRSRLEQFGTQQASAKAEIEAAAASSAGNNIASVALSATNDAVALVRERCGMLSNRDRCPDIGASAVDAASLLTALDRGTEGARGMAGTIEVFNNAMAPASASIQRAAFLYLQATAAIPGLNARANALTIASASGGGVPTPETLANAVRTRDAAQASLDAARANLDVATSGAAADVQGGMNAVESARAALTTAVARRDQVVGGPLPSDVVQQGQSVLQSELSLRRAQNDREAAVLVAPYDGLIGPVTMTVGEPSGTGSIVLVDPLSMQLNASVQEADVGRLRPGQSVQLTFDALAGTTQQGRVFSISPTADVVQGVSSYAVVVEIPPRPGAGNRIDLRTGMAGTAAVEISRRDNALAIPSRALRRSGRDQTVEVQVAGGKTETRVVKVGATDGTFTEVTDGLKEGDVVVIPTATTTTRPATTGQQQGPGAGGAVIPAGPPPGGGR